MSTLNVDALVGNTSANAITVRGEGTATTSLQQGLGKFFSNINGTGTIATRDSFNQSGITDNGTGDFSFAFTTNMGNDDYAHMTNADSGSGHLALQYDESQQTTSGCRTFVIENNHTVGTTDSSVVMGTVNGDLA